MAIKTVELEIKGMTCDHCALFIGKKVAQLDGIVSQSVSFPAKSGQFQYDEEKVSKPEIIQAIDSTGQYQVVREIERSPDDAQRFDLIIIGSGSAAFSAAIKASELEKKVLMINDGLPIGGTCVNVGCVPSKTLIRTAEQFYHANHPHFSEIKPGKNSLDFKEVVRQKTELVSELRQSKYVNVLQDDANVTILHARAKLIDNHQVEAAGNVYTGEKILLATGSNTFVPDIPGLNDTGYLTNETLYDLETLPEHLIVLGGRYIALENAPLFARLGSKVTILQRSLRILPDEMPDVTETLKEFLEAEGIDIKTGVQIKSVEQKNGKVTVQAVVRDEEAFIEGTHLFVATGRKGNSQGMGLENAGVDLHGQGFIKTNEFFQTTTPNIYAAGDITGDHLFVYAAAYEGALAVENMFGEKPTAKDYSIFPWVIFTDPQVAGVGMDENQAYANKIDFENPAVRIMSHQDSNRKISFSDNFPDDL